MTKEWAITQNWFWYRSPTGEEDAGQVYLIDLERDNIFLLNDIFEGDMCKSYLSILFLIDPYIKFSNDNLIFASRNQMKVINMSAFASKGPHAKEKLSLSKSDMAVIDFPMRCWGIFSIEDKFKALFEGSDSSLDFLDIELEGTGSEITATYVELRDNPPIFMNDSILEVYTIVKNN